ncbi:transposase, IS608 family protein [Kalymmatonema gypsitolerans NIES-4073]|nr:transposase, IS608 family protein [Scytonema sp. NIES-4073]
MNSTLRLFISGWKCDTADLSAVILNLPEPVLVDVNSIIDVSNPVIQHGLESPVKYVRLLWRLLNGKRRWYCQLVNEGLPYQKPHQFVSDGLIGLDLNISNIAFVGDNHADLLPFALNVPTFQKEIATLHAKDAALSTCQQSRQF